MRLRKLRFSTFSTVTFCYETVFSNRNQELIKLRFELRKLRFSTFSTFSTLKLRFEGLPILGSRILDPDPGSRILDPGS